MNEDKGQIVQTYGFILGVHPQADPKTPFIYTTTPFGPGFSGGPVINKLNQVIGLATIEGQSVNLALPINTVNQYLDAKTFFPIKSLLDQDKISLEAMYYRGSYFLHELADPDKAIVEFKKILSKNPNFVLAHYELAAAYQNLGDNQRAIEDYDKAIGLDPSLSKVYFNRGIAYSQLGRHTEANADKARACTLNKQLC